MASSDRETKLAFWQTLLAGLAPPAGIPEYRAGYDKLLGEFPIRDDAQFATIREEAGFRGTLVSAGDATADSTVVWAHSGGYVFGSAAGYRSFGADLSVASGAQVLLTDYRLAPEDPYPAALDDMLAAYQHLLENGREPASIVIGGDSAGGGLAAATILALGRFSLPAHAGLVVVSPFTDHTFTGESMKTRADRDPVVSQEMLDGLGALYRGEVAADDPWISPIYGDWAGAPPTLALVGSDEVLYDDAARLVARAADAGVFAELLVGEGEFHIWPIFSSRSQTSRAAMAQIGDFIVACTA